MRVEVINEGNEDKVVICDAWGSEPPIILYFPRGAVEEPLTEIKVAGRRFIYGYGDVVELTIKTTTKVEVELAVYVEDYDADIVLDNIKTCSTVKEVLEYGPFFKIVVVVGGYVYSCFIEDIHRPKDIT